MTKEKIGKLKPPGPSALIAAALDQARSERTILTAKIAQLLDMGENLDNLIETLEAAQQDAAESGL